VAERRLHRHPNVSYQLPITTHHPPFTTHHLPFTVYLFNFSCKTNPILKNTEISVTSVVTMGYANNSPSAAPKANPKQTQANPNKANPTPVFRPLWHPKAKTNPSKPKQTQFTKKTQKTTQLLFSERLTTKMPNSPTQKRTQTNSKRSPDPCGRGFYVIFTFLTRGVPA